MELTHDEVAGAGSTDMSTSESMADVRHCLPEPHSMPSRAGSLYPMQLGIMEPSVQYVVLQSETLSQ